MKATKVLFRTVMLGTIWLLATMVSPFAGSNGFNRPGDLLIADQFNNRVIEVTHSGKIVWQFGLNSPW